MGLKKPRLMLSAFVLWLDAYSRCNCSPYCPIPLLPYSLVSFHFVGANDAGGGVVAEAVAGDF
jgi:hypothetical protein